MLEIKDQELMTNSLPTIIFDIPSQSSVELYKDIMQLFVTYLY